MCLSIKWKLYTYRNSNREQLRKKPPTVPGWNFNSYCILPATRVVHIGMNDTAKEGVYVWEDGSPVTHTRWLKDDPNGSEEENCIGLYRDDGGFVDVKCDTESFFICKTNYGALIF